jgi:hypothetical protein
VLKPSCDVIISEPITITGSSPSLRTIDKLKSSLRLAGLVNPTQIDHTHPINQSTLDELNKLGHEANDVTIATVRAVKPSYGAGTSTPLGLGGATSSWQPISNPQSAQIWTLMANDIIDEDLDLMDSNGFLLDEDLVRPNPASLKSECGPQSGRKKACKNCSCGLADQLQNDSNPSGGPSSNPITSSCGSVRHY